jgi:HrpA-like RNA helicase
LFERASEAVPGLAIQEIHTQPEVRHMSLDQLVLRLKVLPEDVVPGKTVTKVCTALPEHPNTEGVAITAMGLVAIGALETRADEKNEVLKDLGKMLVSLSVDVRIGKLCGKFFVIDSTNSIKYSFTNVSVVLFYSARLRVQQVHRRCADNFGGA